MVFILSTAKHKENKKGIKTQNKQSKQQITTKFKEVLQKKSTPNKSTNSNTLQGNELVTFFGNFQKQTIQNTPNKLARSRTINYSLNLTFILPSYFGWIFLILLFELAAIVINLMR